MASNRNRPTVPTAPADSVPAVATVPTEEAVIVTATDTATVPTDTAPTEGADGAPEGTTPAAPTEGADGAPEGTTPAAPTVDHYAAAIVALDHVVETADMEAAAPSDTALETLVAAYRALKRPDREKLIKLVGERMMASMSLDDQLATMKVYAQINAALTAVTSSATAAPVDPYAAPVLTWSAVALSARALLSLPLGDGIDAETLSTKINTVIESVTDDMITSYAAWLATDGADDRPDAPTVPDALVSAFAIATGTAAAKKPRRSTGNGGTVTASGSRGDIGRHMIEVLSANPGNWMTTAEINAAPSSEYPAGLKSGAVGARCAAIAKGTSEVTNDSGHVDVRGRSLGIGEGTVSAVWVADDAAADDAADSGSDDSNDSE